MQLKPREITAQPVRFSLSKFRFYLTPRPRLRYSRQLEWVFRSSLPTVNKQYSEKVSERRERVGRRPGRHARGETGIREPRLRNKASRLNNPGTRPIAIQQDPITKWIHHGCIIHYQRLNFPPLEKFELNVGFSRTNRATNKTLNLNVTKPNAAYLRDWFRYWSKRDLSHTRTMSYRAFSEHVTDPVQLEKNIPSNCIASFSVGRNSHSLEFSNFEQGI